MVNAESDLLNELAQQIQEAVQYLDRSRLTITRHANRLDNSRNPAVSLPQEIIAEVLYAGLPKVKTHTDWITYSQYTRAISSVCQKWREAALGYSRLWDSLLISKYAAESSDAQWLNEDLARRLILSRQTDIHAHYSLAFVLQYLEMESRIPFKSSSPSPTNQNTFSQHQRCLSP